MVFVANYLFALECWTRACFTDCVVRLFAQCSGRNGCDIEFTFGRLEVTLWVMCGQSGVFTYDFRRKLVITALERVLRLKVMFCVCVSEEPNVKML